MLTYNLKEKDGPLYKSLYENIRSDINRGILRCGDKLPSKRTLARNLGISIITVEKAYDQLIGEGYLYTLPQKGYYVANTVLMQPVFPSVPAPRIINRTREKEKADFDFSSNMIESNCFPFSIWAKILRETISMKERELMTNPPCNGIYELRSAIAKHLSGFRGMSIDPDQIVVGAGTEYLYSLLTKLIGENKVYCIENPGYKKLKSIYVMNIKE